MRRIVFMLLLMLLFLQTEIAAGAVHLALEGRSPVVVEEVYRRDGLAFLPLEEVLSILGLSGSWDSVRHIYTIDTPAGRALISPGSQFLRLNGRFHPLTHPPAFIDGKLRVDENFVALHLPAALRLSVYYRDLDADSDPLPSDSSLDRLFSLLLRQQQPAGRTGLRSVVIDPAHGGGDPGSIGPGGLTEKEVVLGVAQKLQRLLRMHLDLPVHLSRTGDYSLTPKQRFELVSQTEADALILLHAQSSLSPRSRGTVLFVRPREGNVDATDDSMLLARELRQALVRAGIPVAAVERAPLLPLGKGDLPTVLIELGYLSHPADRELLGRSEGRERLAEALFQGLQSYAQKLPVTPQQR